jgi:hypothetical protein
MEKIEGELRQKTCDKSNKSQDFIFSPKVDGLPTHPEQKGVQIIDRPSGTCAESGDKDVCINSKSCNNDKDDQKFVLTKDPKNNCQWEIKEQKSDAVIEPTDRKKDELNTYSVKIKQDVPEQKWIITPRNDKPFYEIKNVGTGKCMEKIEGELRQKTCDKSNKSQDFTFNPKVNGLPDHEDKPADPVKPAKIEKANPPGVFTDEWVYLSHANKAIHHPERIDSYYYTYTFQNNYTYRYKFLKTVDDSYIITSFNREGAMGLGKDFKDRAQDAYSRNLPSQRWKLIQDTKDPLKFFIQNVENKNCLKQIGGGDWLVHSECNFKDHDTQLFTFKRAEPKEPKEDDGVQITDRSGENCVFSSLSRDSDISAGKCDMTPAFENFMITHADNGSFLITLKHSALPIAIKHVISDRWAKTKTIPKDSYELEVFRDEPIFKWKITPREGTKFYEIRSVHNGQCWEISKDKVVQKPCDGSKGQDFAFDPDISSLITTPKPKLPAVPVHPYRNYRYSLAGFPSNAFNIISKIGKKCAANTNTPSHTITLEQCNRNSFEQRFQTVGMGAEFNGIKTIAAHSPYYLQTT